jgi:hypothetical protein
MPLPAHQHGEPSWHDAGMAELPTMKGRDARSAALSEVESLWHALACTDRLIATDDPARRAELRGAFDTAQGLSESGARTVAGAAAAGLLARPDVDDGPVAAVVYAIRAVLGSSDAARRAAPRSLDAAFAPVPYPPHAESFRPLEEDMASAVAQHEPRWQLGVADVASTASSV